jgi:hypothetical protein
LAASEPYATKIAEYRKARAAGVDVTTLDSEIDAI